MPESPVSAAAQFSKAPEGKKVMTADEMQTMVHGKLQAAAQALGGRVVGDVDTPEAAPQAEEKVPEQPAYEVSDVIRQQYLRSLLSKEPFLRSYELFGGRVQVAFRTMKSKEAEAISQSSDGNKLKQRLETSLYTLDVGPDLTKLQPKTLDDLDDVAVSAVYNAFKDFELLCDELFRRANDTDFWTRTAGRI